MTQLEAARAGQTTDLMKRVAEAEGLTAEAVRAAMAEGHLVIPANKGRMNITPCGVGRGTRVKVNANIGTSHDFNDPAIEMEKLRVAVEAGSDTIMDLSTGGDITAMRKKILDASPVPVGSVPIYEAIVSSARAGKQGIRGLTGDDILACIRQHCEDGVDFVVLHCGITQEIVKHIIEHPRHCGIVSRGGTFLATWIRLHEEENPLLERFDEALAILHEHDVTLNLGDGLRPGALADSFDYAQIAELRQIAKLAERAREAGVQVMIEGPGHVPLHQVEAQMRIQKALCNGAPFYVLGPVVTDIAPGYDHITSAIGGALAARAGADFLCYVTPTEHLGLPEPEHVREGVIASRIAAHAADIARGHPGAIEWDHEFSGRRRERDWDAQFAKCIDPIKARALRDSRHSENDTVCSMCGDFCVFKMIDDLGLGPQQ